MNDFKSLHPICIFAYFVVMIVMLLICNHPVVMLSACAGAVFLLLNFKEHSMTGMLKWILPLILIITIANPLLNHRGVTRVCFLFGQWITLEAICYGVASGLSSDTFWSPQTTHYNLQLFQEKSTIASQRHDHASFPAFYQLNAWLLIAANITSASITFLSI